MATYKVLQDIEAEDKFVGPLTLKQFILACITVVAGWLCFFLITKHLWFLTLPILPVMLFAAFLAIPWGRDQPTETWLLAKVRFFLKPRNRIWDQSGIQELVTITAPKRTEQQFTGDNLSQIEVKSRLRALADTIDSHGWAIKNVNVNMFTQPGYGIVNQSTDRLVDASTLVKEVPSVDIQASEDMLDERNNPTAQHLDQMITASSSARREGALQQIQDVRDHSGSKKPAKSKAQSQAENKLPADFWFMNELPPVAKPKDYTTFTAAPAVQPGSDSDDDTGTASSSPLTDEEQKLLDRRHKEADRPPVQYGNTHIIEPLGKQKKHKSHGKAKAKTSKHAPATHHKAAQPSKPTVTQTPDPAILSFAKDNNLSVGTIAHEINQKREPESPEGEVIVPLR